MTELLSFVGDHLFWSLFALWLICEMLVGVFGSARVVVVQAKKDDKK